MKFQINARSQVFEIDLPESLVERACEYALGVVAQRETASMAENTEAERIEAIRARFARIQSGDWQAGGGRSANPIARELTAALRTAAVKKKAKLAYEVKDVPKASAGTEAVLEWVADHFTQKNGAALLKYAQAMAEAKADPLA